MRVMHLSGSARGGAELQLLHLLQTASERGSRDEHSVLLVRPGPLEGAFDEVAPTVVSAKSHAVDLRFIRDVIRQILRERPDVVHSWGPTPNLWGPVLTRIAQLSPRGLRLRLHPRVIMAEVGLDEWKGRLLKAADRLCYRLADRIVGNAAGVTEAAIRRGADPEKADTVLLGAHIPPRDQLPQRQPVPGRVLLLGRWDWRKGHEAMLRIWPQIRRSVPGAHLVMAGAAHSAAEKTLQARCEKLVERLETDPELAGSVTLLDHTDPVQALDQAQMLVVPSSSEGLPNVILEAFARRVPVVAYDVGGIGEAVRAGKTGWLVDAGDETGFASAALEALREPAEAARRAEAARTWVEALTFESSLAAWESVYRKGER